MTEAVLVSGSCKTKIKKLGEKQHRVIIALRIKNRLLLFLLGLFPLIIDDIKGTWSIISAASFEIVILLLILLRAILERENHRWIFERNRITEQRGIVSKKGIYVSSALISSATIERSPILSLFHAVKIESGTSNCDKKPMSLYMSEENGFGFIKQAALISKNAVKYRAGKASILINAISTTNVISGLLFLIPALFRLKKVINADLNLRLFGSFAQKLEPYISYGVAFAVGAAAVGWIAGFIVKCFESGYFTLSADRKCITCAQGVIIRKLDCVKTKSILCFDERETLFFRALKRKSLYCAYDGREHLLLPSVKKREYERAKRQFLSKGATIGVRASVPERGRFGWWRVWLLWLTAATAVMIKLCYAHNILTVLSIFAPLLIGITWRAAVCHICAGEAYIESDSKYFSVRTVNIMTIHTFTVFHGNVESAMVTVSPFQKEKGLCTVRIRLLGQKRNIKCKNLPEGRARAVIEKIRAA